jgi:carbon-monoxide dehydrogenase medium subunit
VKPCAFDYAAPATIAEAAQLLNANADGAKLIAGGQSLAPALNFRLASPRLLIDLNRIPALSGIVRWDDGSWRAGAMTRHRAFERSALVAGLAPLVHAVMPSIAHVQIRNRGTIGGSLAHADPAAEWPALCLACEVELALTSVAGTRSLAAEAFSLGVFSTALMQNEILSAIEFPAWPAMRRWGFQEIARRRGDFAIAGVMCTVDLDDEGRCMAARIVVFGVADKPTLVPEASTALAGRLPSLALAREAGRIARACIVPRGDLHASAAYRAELVEVLTRRALVQAFALAERAAA